MKRLLASLPILLVLADMVYGFILNILQSLNTNHTSKPSDGLPVSPDIAFNGLQAISNGSMILIIGFGLFTLLTLQQSVSQQKAFSLGIFRILGLISVLAFTLPSLWQWGWALIQLATGNNMLNISSPRYLIVALCQPLIALSCLWNLAALYRLRNKQV